MARALELVLGPASHFADYRTPRFLGPRSDPRELGNWVSISDSEAGLAALAGRGYVQESRSLRRREDEAVTGIPGRGVVCGTALANGPLGEDCLGIAIVLGGGGGNYVQSVICGENTTTTSILEP